MTHLNGVGWLKVFNPKASKDPSSADSEVETLHELCEEEGPTLEPAFPIIDTQLPC